MLFLCTPTKIYAQYAAIDSLKAAYKHVKKERDRVDLLNELGEAYHEKDLEQGLIWTYRALNMAGRIDYPEGVFIACRALGVAYDLLGKIDSSYYYYRACVELAVGLEDTWYLADAKNNFGLYYLFQGNYPLALQYLQEALSIDQSQSDFIDPVITLNNIGVIHEEMGNLNKALEYYQRAVDEAYRLGGEINEAFGDLCLGYMAYKKKNYPEAKKYYQKALRSYERQQYQTRLAETLFYLGEVYLAENEFEQALEYENRALRIYLELKSINDLPTMYRVIAKIYQNMNKDAVALQYYERAVEIARENDMPTELVTIYDEMANMYIGEKDYKNAYKYQMLYRTVNDTIYGIEAKNRISEMEIAYELKVKKVEFDKLKAEQVVNKTILRQRTLLAVGAVLIALLIALLALSYYRESRQKSRHNRRLEKEVAERTAELRAANAKLLESNEDLEKFTYLASHDLKEPLRNISSFINLIQRRIEELHNPELNEYLQFVMINSKRMYRLVEDVLTLSRLNAGETLETSSLDVKDVVEDVCMSMDRLIREKNAQIEVGDLPFIEAPRAHLFLIFKNLIENGIKYNEAPFPKINIYCRTDYCKNEYQFVVRDNGIGIDPRYHAEVFEMFKRLNSREKYMGTGMGLAICRKILKKYGGEIGLCSKKGEGAAFYFSFPINEQAAPETISEAYN